MGKVVGLLVFSSNGLFISLMDGFDVSLTVQLSYYTVLNFSSVMNASELKKLGFSGTYFIFIIILLLSLLPLLLPFLLLLLFFLLLLARDLWLGTQ